MYQLSRLLLIFLKLNFTFLIIIDSKNLERVQENFLYLQVLIHGILQALLWLKENNNFSIRLNLTYNFKHFNIEVRMKEKLSLLKKMMHLFLGQKKLDIDGSMLALMKRFITSCTITKRMFYKFQKISIFLIHPIIFQKFQRKKQCEKTYVEHHLFLQQILLLITPLNTTILQKNIL